ncbi:MAG: M48 family metallopeptidase [Candidatus Izimaplasma sp.]|nr:M48 family metallopeptidase [Candidatus Izimaplasma bacterium]
MDCITLNNIEIPIKIHRKNNKHTYFYFKTNHILITTNHKTPRHVLRTYLKKHQQTILKKWHKRPKQKDSSNYLLFGKTYGIKETKDNVYYTDNTIYLPADKNTIKLFEKETLLHFLNTLKQKYLDNKIVDLTDTTIHTRYTKTRFGSCNKRLKRLNFNLDLIHYKKELIEYVFLHEITHLKHMNHSQFFYHTLEQLCPNYKKLRLELKEEFKR